MCHLGQGLISIRIQKYWVKFTKVFVLMNEINVLNEMLVIIIIISISIVIFST